MNRALCVLAQQELQPVGASGAGRQRPSVLQQKVNARLPVVHMDPSAGSEQAMCSVCVVYS